MLHNDGLLTVHIRQDVECEHLKQTATVTHSDMRQIEKGEVGIISNNQLDYVCCIPSTRAPVGGNKSTVYELNVSIDCQWII